MLYAHIFKKGSKYELIITEGPALTDPRWITLEFSSRAGAKAYAAEAGALPWNY